MSSLLGNEIFSRSLGELDSIGFRVHTTPVPSDRAYAVIGGRSNARWWLVPLSNRRVTVSGLALFQPAVPSARVLKGAAVCLGRMGLSRIWARNIVYLSTGTQFEQFFPGSDLQFSFFTGTDSPHRKTAIQIMDNVGNIKGFAKVTKEEHVKLLLAHESDVLRYLMSLDLQTAYIPNLLFHGGLGSAEVLVTDTLKSDSTNTTTKLTKGHLDFLKELAAKSQQGEPFCESVFVKSLPARLGTVQHLLPDKWKMRLHKAMELVGGNADYMEAETTFCHGDFTPWNTFFVNNKLYAFDWEYASHGCPPGYDLIHFVYAVAMLENEMRPAQFIDRICHYKNDMCSMHNVDGLSDNTINVLLCAYLLDIILRYVSREVNHDIVDKYLNSIDAKNRAEILDRILC